jgi:DNA replication and repair protein RecF
VAIELSPKLSLFVGANGSGKSSLVESLYYLGFGRSFRSNKPTSLIRRGDDRFTVFASGEQSGTPFTVGVERRRDDDAILVSVNGQRSAKMADIASLIPVQLFTPQSTDSILSSPLERRRSCDWGLFHVEHEFVNVSGRYNRILRHRNALLRSSMGIPSNVNDLDYWTDALAVVGSELSALREVYLAKLTPIFLGICKEFLPEFNVEISYYRGWEKEVGLDQAMARKVDADTRLGHTSIGPHKADIRIRVNGVAIQELLSRGQQRMIVAAFQLSQTVLHRDCNKSDTLFLLDDVGAELDANKRDIFIRRLLALNSQVVVTAIDAEQIAFLNEYPIKKMFHVEHNRVIEQ